MSLNFDVRQPPDWLLDAGGCRMNDLALPLKIKIDKTGSQKGRPTDCGMISSSDSLRPFPTTTTTTHIS